LERAESVKRKSVLREVVEVVVLALVIYFAVTSLIQTVRVSGLSMYPTLKDQDYLIATKFDYRLHHPHRGDIVTLKPPCSAGPNSPLDSQACSEDFIKRVVAVPGDRLSIVNGRVSVNGRAASEPYLRRDQTWTVNANWPAQNPAQGQVLGADQYFVMGDNRNFSTDSRIFGPISGEAIQTHAWIRLWPPGTIGTVGPGPSLSG
jgi:signal peptidase I